MSKASVLSWVFFVLLLRHETLFAFAPRRKTRHASLSTLRASSWENNEQENPALSSSIRVGIAGTGAIGLATAALLNDAGHEATLWTPPRGSKDRDPDNNQQDDAAKVVTVTGKMQGAFTPQWVESARKMVLDTDVIILCLPSNGHKRVLEDLAPHLQQHHTVIISSHASFGALYLRKLNNRPLIVAWGTTVATARRQKNLRVHINTIRQAIDWCTVPSTSHAKTCAQKLLPTLFPQITNFVPRNDVVAISLSNLNPQNHLGIALGNMSRMEKHEDWYQSLNITPAIGRLLQALDKERLDIAEKCNALPLKTIFEHFGNSFHVPISDSIADMNQQIHALDNDVYGPNTAHSRYILEDVPYGLVPTVVLGRMVHQPAVLHEAGIQLISAMYGRDFQGENDLLQALQLEQWSWQELQTAARTGVIPATGFAVQLQQKQTEPHRSQQEEEQPAASITSQRALS